MIIVQSFPFMLRNKTCPPNKALPESHLSVSHDFGELRYFLTICQRTGIAAVVEITLKLKEEEVDFFTSTNKFVKL